MIMNKDELLEINGGGFGWGVFSAIVGGLVFIIGVIDGYVRPYACRK